MSKEKLQSIPANILTGFLGSGKTTAVQHLLKQKPEDERWAVLVNEFGEVGIDENLFSGAQENHGGITISQVPGGCMCCTNGLPMQMALNLLLAKAKPHRLLIELTGLGHPKEVLAVLAGQYYRDVLSVQATLALVDARKIQDSRFVSNPNFNQQIEIAEIVIANKSDLYADEDFPALLDFIDVNFELESKLIYQVEQGAIALEWLAHSNNQQGIEPLHIEDSKIALTPTLETPDEGYVRADNQGDGFYSRGWIFNSAWQFDEHMLIEAFHGIEVERLKGVFKTTEGVVAFNMAEDVLTQTPLEGSSDSRVEVICSDARQFDGLEEAILKCVLNRNEASPSLARSESQNLNENAMDM